MSKKHTYEITKGGRVLSLTNWRGYGRRELGQTPNNDGYPSVRIIIDGERKRIAVHRLVCEKFHGLKPTPAHEVCHIDGNKLNNHTSNLRWGTRKDNAEDRERHGRTARGERLSAAIRASSHRERVKRGADHYWTRRVQTNV